MQLKIDVMKIKELILLKQHTLTLLETEKINAVF
jgi:hypothetical protein